MSSHVRYILHMQGGYYGGPDVFAMLSRYVGTLIKTRNEAINASKKLSVRLWIFREPRGIKKTRSRYKQMCAHLGIYPKIKKKAANYAYHVAAPIVQEMPNANPFAGQAPQQHPW